MLLINEDCVWQRFMQCPWLNNKTISNGALLVHLNIQDVFWGQQQLWTAWRTGGLDWNDSMENYSLQLQSSSSTHITHTHAQTRISVDCLAKRQTQEEDMQT